MHLFFVPCYTVRMTQEQFKYSIDVKKEFEFVYNKKTYNITYDTDERGAYIAFGRLYDTPTR